MEPDREPLAPSPPPLLGPPLLPGMDERARRGVAGTSALVASLGPLGDRVAFELAAAGVGRLVLADPRSVTEADLARSPLVAPDALGAPRAEAAARRLRELVPAVEVRAEAGDAAQAARLVPEAGVVVPCSPDLAERLAWNAAAVAARRPLVEAGLHGLQAQVTTVVPGESACLACLFAGAPAERVDERSIAAPLAAVVAGVVALEVVKLVTGLGDPLVHRLWTLDAGAGVARSLEVERRADCEVCGAGRGAPGSRRGT